MEFGSSTLFPTFNLIPNVIMFDNHIYNLTKQMVQEHKSLWRIKKHYKDDAGDCADCKAFWEKMEADKEAHITEIQNLLASHMERE